PPRKIDEVVGQIPQQTDLRTPPDLRQYRTAHTCAETESQCRRAPLDVRRRLKARVVEVRAESRVDVEPSNLGEAERRATKGIPLLGAFVFRTRRKREVFLASTQRKERAHSHERCPVSTQARHVADGK